MYAHVSKCYRLYYTSYGSRQFFVGSISTAKIKDIYRAQTDIGTNNRTHNRPVFLILGMRLLVTALFCHYYNKEVRRIKK